LSTPPDRRPGVTETGRGAVFLSYASEDAAAAERICTALRAGGIEVWYDRSELRGGDAWDAAIRRQIKGCALFLPIISANTHARIEGYFRLEWKLAIDRSHLIAPDQPFLVPVAIDATPQADERIPDRFRELQWTRLPGGETPPSFVERIHRLLAPHADTPPAATLRSPLGQSATAIARAGGGCLRASIWGLVLIIVVPVIGYYATEWYAMHRGGVAPADVSASNEETVPEKSIAVLPFVDMSEKKDQEYFSDGLAEELLDLLSQVPDLHVPARTSSFYFKGRSEDVATIARKLRVAHVLEGSVRRSGDRIRVTAQLIRADNGYHLWSKTYDREAKDVFQVQDEIAGAVVSALKAQLLTAQPLTHNRTAIPAAYDEYLMGNKLRERDTKDSNREALESYQRAAALDPNYADAYAGIADAEWRLADMVTGEAAGYERALAAAEHAIRLAPDSANGYWARAGVRSAYFYDWEGAEADYRRALELDPNDVRVLRDYSSLRAARDGTREALELMRRATQLDPLSARTWRAYAQLLLDADEPAAAEEASRHLQSIVPNSVSAAVVSGQVALAQGRFQDALAQFRTDDGPWRLIGSAMAEHSLGHAAESQAALDELQAKYAATLAYQIAEVYAWRGEEAQALSWLERAYRQHDGGLVYLRHDRFLPAVHALPGYRKLVQELKLPP
jgi:adenylate cyclase